MRYLIGIVLALFALCTVSWAAEIHTAAASGDIDLIGKLLKSKPALVHAKDADGATPLHWAADKGYVDAIELLIKQRANVNAQKKNGVTPLHVAAAMNQEAAVKVLLANGADPAIKDQKERTALDIAQSKGYDAIIQLLSPSEHVTDTVNSMPDPAQSKPKPNSVVHVLYYSMYVANIDEGRFGGWDEYNSVDGTAHDPSSVRGPEQWRYDLALGSGAPESAAHYPYLGRYDNFSDDNIVRWHFQLMRNAGINVVCASNFAHRDNPNYIDRLLKIAGEAGLNVYIMDENASVDISKAATQEVLDKAIDDYAVKCKEVLAKYGNDPAYYKIDGRPAYFLPFRQPGFGESDPEHIDIIQKALKRFHDLATTPELHPWLISENAYCANLVGDLSYDRNTALPAYIAGITQAWADTGFDSFTCSSPLGLGEQYNRKDIGQEIRENNIKRTFADYIENQKQFGLTPIVPIQVGYDRRNCEGPGSPLLASDPSHIIPHDAIWWKTLVTLAFDSGAPHVWIAQWNNWREDQVLEPAWGFRNLDNNDDPFAFLSILATAKGEQFSEPSMPPITSIDSAVLQRINSN